MSNDKPEAENAGKVKKLKLTKREQKMVERILRQGRRRSWWRRKPK